jgi:hypothetical protein
VGCTWPLLSAVHACKRFLFNLAEKKFEYMGTTTFFLHNVDIKRSVADPEPGSGGFFVPWIRDHLKKRSRKNEMLDYLLLEKSKFFYK